MAKLKKSQLPDAAQRVNTWRDDWRVMGQEGYLMDKKLQHLRFSRELVRDDFDQCEFCWAVFDKDKDHPTTAYFEPLGQYWICEDCFRDFQKNFCWIVEELL